ncbi:MAG TPA: cytochrome c [Rhodanobacteraceae bacterium]|nr:cytochrome c [Rhodanobacteraceae bacterium]
MKKKMWAIFGGALLLYVVIVMFIAVGPAIDLSMTPPGPGVEPLTPLQEEGRQVFASNGCGYCHTQQVRPLPEDKVFGRPSAPGDFAYQTPELLGSERTGPDLTNVGNTKPSDVWQYIHLYDPRAVEPESIMPNFKFLFRVVDKVPEGDTAVPVPAAFAPKRGYVIPTQKAKALVAYLLSLKQPAIPGYHMNGGMGGPTSVASSAPAGSAAAGGYAFDPAKGQQLFTANCSACHQTTGEGIPGAFPPLVNNPAVDAADPTLHIETILHGAHGKTIAGKTYSSQMPPFAGQLSDVEIADIANHERTSWGNHAKEVTPVEVAAIRAGKPLGAASSAPAASAPTGSAPAASAAAGGYTFDAAKGKSLFTANCSACHQATGEGIPGAFPPLKGNAAVDNADPTLHLHTILHGAHGVVVGGVKYSSAMPPFAGQLSDTEIADIANYERSSWGNHAQPVTPADVAKVRAAK